MTIYNRIPEVVEGDAWPASAHNLYILGNFATGIPHIFSAKGDIAIATAADEATNLAVGTNGKCLVRDDGEASGVKWDLGGIVPVGGILIWSGSVGTIPTGWQICDGTNSTPDLRDRFIVGSGSTYTTDDTGGAATKDLTHSHASGGSTSSTGDHTHTLPGSGDLTGGGHAHGFPTNAGYLSGGWKGGRTGAGVSFSNYASHYHAIPGGLSTSSDGAHTHTISGTPSNAGTHSHVINDTAGDGLTASESILPPYYALAYIMRMS